MSDSHSADNVHSGLTAVMVITMTAAAFQLFAMSVVSVDILDDLSISAGQLGFIGAANTVVGAAFSPRSGSITDRLGARRSVVIVLGLSAIGMFVAAAAQSWWMLLASTMLSGLPQGWGNPATNKLIAERVSQGRRGVVTGIKQSGVQLGSFLAGITMPAWASRFGWRTGLAGYGLMFAAAAVWAAASLPPDVAHRHGEVAGPAAGDALPRAIYRTALYAFFMGNVTGATGRFLPLFAHDQLGMTETTAGLAVALMGGLAVLARITWGRVAETHLGTRPSMMLMAVLSALTSLVLLAATSVGSALVWIAAVVAAFSVAAWNTVAMLSVISGTHRAQAGRASGVVVLGFLGGLSTGSSFTGWSFDLTGGYGTAWLVMAVLSALALATAASSPHPAAVS